MVTYWYIRHRVEGPIAVSGSGWRSVRSNGSRRRDWCDVTCFWTLREARETLELLRANKTKQHARQFVLMRVTRCCRAA